MVLARSRRWAAAAVLVGALGATALPAVAQPAGGGGDEKVMAPVVVPDPAPLSWVPCTVEMILPPEQLEVIPPESIEELRALLEKEQVECARLQVPVNYDYPAGLQMGIGVTRMKAKDPAARLGSLAFNPGGPGGGGMLLPASLAEQIPDLAAAYDLIGFDPRFVGMSEALLCPNPDIPTTSAPFDTWEGWEAMLSAQGALAAACQAAVGPLVNHTGTLDVARDLEMLRKALGEPKLDYVGWSYGTRIGATYAQLFPAHVGRMLLDSALYPELTPAQFSLDAVQSIEALLWRYFDWCSGQPACPWADPAAAWDAVMEKLRAQNDGSYDIVLSVAFSMLKQLDAWPVLTSFLNEIALGELPVPEVVAKVGAEDPAPEPPSETGAYLFTSVMCLDTAGRATPQDSAAVFEAGVTMGPRMGYIQLARYASFTSCLVPPRPVPPMSVGPEQGLPGIMVVGIVDDPQTPFPWTQQLAASLPGSSMLVSTGVGHGAFIGDTCVTAHGTSYLLTGVLPPVGSVCVAEEPVMTELPPVEAVEGTGKAVAPNPPGLPEVPWGL